MPLILCQGLYACHSKKKGYQDWNTWLCAPGILPYACMLWCFERIGQVSSSWVLGAEYPTVAQRRGGTAWDWYPLALCLSKGYKALGARDGL